MRINISKDYTDTPGGRYICEGEFSGEDFRNTLLEPKFLESKNNNEKLTIDFDDTYGYSDSFLEEAFGGLARKYTTNVVNNILQFISNDEPSLIKKVEDYIRNCNMKRN